MIIYVKSNNHQKNGIYVKYLDPNTSGTPCSVFAQLINDLANNTAGVVIDGATAGTNPMPFAGLMGYGGDNSTGPKAYLNILVFDQNYQLLSSSFRPVTSAAKETGTNIPHQLLKTNQITIEKPGYVYIYLSNENATPVEVFFDDFKVTHTNTPIVQKDDYYPFGMTFNSYSAPSGVGQKFKFNGKEREELTGWDDFGARMYMSDLGRWGVVDPLAEVQESWNPYHFNYNNPIVFTDPTGMLPRYNWDTGKYEDEGKVVSFEDAMAAHGIDVHNSNQNYGNGKREDRKDQSGQRIDLSKADAGIKLAETLRNYFTAKGDDPSTPRLYLEDFIDSGSKLSNTYGYDPITNSTSGKRKIGEKYVKITVYVRRDVNGKILEQNSDNSIRSIKTDRGIENAANGMVYSRVTIQNGSGNGVIVFEINASKRNATAIQENVQYIMKLREYISGRESVKIEKR
ncbi:RHS repeat-associated core domain-containing protein [Belliella sp. R4-6]|uniref:RHS repeat-associated core domain-containing protein n=1 Tax=Belliella alkalica TaxID=1730871 RepID=A0ABS9VGZ4_9BACT|nr:RHS repeat-associated core domain-containing protein [Belliella alkalica]MCH7415711.1 RHS repeat-associated core domain-containing protein [Belliella alkalica]